MRIQRVGVHLTVDNLNDFLQRLLGTDEMVAASNGELAFRWEAGFGLLKTPIDLHVQVVSVQPDSLTLAITSPSLSAGATQEILRTMVKTKGIPGFSVHDGHLVVLINDVIAPWGLQVALKSVTLGADGIDVVVEDVAWTMPDAVEKSPAIARALPVQS